MAPPTPLLQGPLDWPFPDTGDKGRVDGGSCRPLSAGRGREPWTRVLLSWCVERRGSPQIPVFERQKGIRGDGTDVQAGPRADIAHPQGSDAGRRPVKTQKAVCLKT